MHHEARSEEVWVLSQVTGSYNIDDYCSVHVTVKPKSEYFIGCVNLKGGHDTESRNLTFTL